MEWTKEEEDRLLLRSGITAFLKSDALAMVKANYHGPQRHYHDWNHALNVLLWADVACRHRAAFDPIALRIAALVHDVVYDSEGSPSNEQRSAAVVRLLGLEAYGLESRSIAHIERLILVTAKHGALEREDVDPDEALMLDADLHSFAEENFDYVLANDANIERELAYTRTAEEIAVGRKAFLEKMLAKRSIFLSDFFRDRGFEVRARDNIRRLLSRERS